MEVNSFFIILIILVVLVIGYFTRMYLIQINGFYGEVEVQTIVENNDIFVEPSEQYVTSLGNGYILNFLTNNKLGRAFSILSDKRVYFKGKCYSLINGKARKTFEERTVDLNDITGTGYRRENPIYLYIISIVLFVISVGMFILGLNMNYISDIAQSIMGTIIIISFPLAIIFLITYHMKCSDLFEISFAGGKIAFATSMYNKSEIDEFQKALRRAKDNAVNNLPKSDSKDKNVNTLNVADELEKYSSLLERGIITKEEFDALKLKLLN